MHKNLIFLNVPKINIRIILFNTFKRWYGYCKFFLNDMMIHVVLVVYVVGINDYIINLVTWV